MSYISINTDNKETFSSVSNHFIDYYMTDANGDFVKVYLYLVRLLSAKEPISFADIADHFNLTEKDICRAIRYWIGQDVLKLNYNSSGEVTGITLLTLHEKSQKEKDSMLSRDNLALFKLADKKPDKPQSPEKKDQSDTTQTVKSAPVILNGDFSPLPKRKSFTPEMAEKAKADEQFADVLFEAEAYFGKKLSSNDMEILIYIHDQLGMSADLMEFLIEYCVSRGKKSLRYAERVAIDWYKSDLHTREEVQKRINDTINNPLYRAVFKEMGIKRDEASGIEKAYMDTWQKDLGFETNIILEACRRAIIAKPNSANFAYINGILENWYKDNVSSLADIERLDREFAAKKKSDGKNNSGKSTSFNNYPQRDGAESLDEMEELFLLEINKGDK